MSLYKKLTTPNHTCRIFLRRREPTFSQATSNDQHTPKSHQKHHFYATIFARRRQNGPRRCQNGSRRHQTQRQEEPRSSDPDLSTCMPPTLPPPTLKVLQWNAPFINISLLLIGFPNVHNLQNLKVKKSRIFTVHTKRQKKYSCIPFESSFHDRQLRR